MIDGEGSQRGICLQRGIRDRDGRRVLGAHEPIVRILTQADLPRCVELSSEAHWNQTEVDWLFLIEHAHAYGLELPEEGLVATTVAWDLGERFTWINMVLVTASCRGRGFARELMQHAIAEAESRGCATGLDATALGEPVYQRLGFSGDAQIVRMRVGRVTGQQTQSDCSPLQEGDLAEVAAFDTAVSGFSRAAMLQTWYGRAPNAAWVLRDDHGRLSGFVVGREGRSAYQIGPLVCRAEETARRLLASALSSIDGPVYVDVPAVQGNVQDWLRAQGFEEERSFKRMTRPAGSLSTDWSQTFAIAGPDFG